MKQQIEILQQHKKDLIFFLKNNIIKSPIVTKTIKKELAEIRSRLADFERVKKAKAATLKMERTETPEKLLQFLANATKTYYCAGGHGKAEHNKQRAEYWKSILVKRNIEVPTSDELLKIGQFNGEGSC